MTPVKINFKRDYETHQCRACDTDNETQEHVYDQCKSLMDLNKEQIEKPEFRKLFYGTVKDQLKIPKVFRQNMKLLEEMEK